MPVSMESSLGLFLAFNIFFVITVMLLCALVNEQDDCLLLVVIITGLVNCNMLFDVILYCA